MTFDGAPMFVDGATHVAELVRGMIRDLAGSREGIIRSSSLRVSQRAVAGGGVRIADGSCLIQGKFTAWQGYYYGRNMGDQDVVIAATGAAARSDMVIARVEDPQYEGVRNPATDPIFYPYVASNVAGTATKVSDVSATMTGIPLARIDIPANTATITDAMVVDLRKMANPRRSRQMFNFRVAAQSDLTSAAWAAWPPGASWQVDVPDWANQVMMSVLFNSLRGDRFDVNTAGGFWGGLRAGLNGVAYTPESGYDWNIPAVNNYDRSMMAVSGSAAVPANVRGTTQTLWTEGYKTGGNTSLRVDSYSSVLADLEFVEVPG